MGVGQFILVSFILLVVLGGVGFAFWYFVLRDESEDNLLRTIEPIPPERGDDVRILVNAGTAQVTENGYLYVDSFKNVKWNPIEVEPTGSIRFNSKQVQKTFTGVGTNVYYYPTQITFDNKVLDFDGTSFVLVSTSESSSDDYFNWIFLPKDRVANRFNDILIWRKNVDISEVLNESYFVDLPVPIGKNNLVYPFRLCSSGDTSPICKSSSYVEKI